MSKSTSEELKRDLALCDAASLGPWTYSPQKGEVGRCLVAQVWGRDGKNLAEVEPVADEGGASATAAMMAAAREGWPAAICRLLDLCRLTDDRPETFLTHLR